MVTIEQFLNSFRSKETRTGYKVALTQYFDVIKIPPSEYFEKGRRYEDDVVAFLDDLEGKGLAPKSIKCKVEGAVRSFLLENNVELPRRFWKRLKISSQAITQDRLFTKEELRQIFIHMDVLGRAVASVQLSSGVKIEDVLQIKISDMHLEKNPVRFYYMNHKIGKRWIGFLTVEAKTIVLEWLKVRESYMLQHVWRNAVHHGLTDLGFEEFMEENKLDILLFPIKRGMVYYRWWYALDCANLNQRDPNTHRRFLHNHTFRQYLKSWAGTVLQESVVEALMGHTRGLSDVRTIYNKYGSDCEDSLAQDFLKIEHLLTLGVGDARSEKEIENLKQLILKQQDIVDWLVQRDINDCERREAERKFLENLDRYARGDEPVDDGARADEQ